MKFTRQQIEEQNLTVWQFMSKSMQYRQVKIPEEVDTDTGTILFWTVPSVDSAVLLAERKFTSDQVKSNPEEVDLILRKVTGIRLRVVDVHEKIVAETNEKE